MKSKEIIARVDQLILKGEGVLSSVENETRIVNPSYYAAFKASSLTFIKNLYGIKSPYFIEFRKPNVFLDYAATEVGIEILKCIKEEIEKGWYGTIKEIVSAEIFSDFLEMADHLLSEEYKDAAAVMVGGVLEEHLRNLCIKHKIETYNRKEEKNIPKKTDTLNSELAKAGVYNKLDHKSITALLDLRNKAAHGRYDDYSKQQVCIMLSSVSDLIVRTK